MTIKNELPLCVNIEYESLIVLIKCLALCTAGQRLKALL